MATAYRVTLDWSLKARWLMILITLASIVLTVWAFGFIKKGFLPVEDTALLIVRTEASPDIAFTAMLERQRRVTEVIRQDPDVLYYNSSVAASNFNPNLNRGNIFVQLKPRHDRAGHVTISQVQARLRGRLAAIPGIRAFPVPLQSLRIGGRVGSAAYQYTLLGIDQAELFEWAPKLIEKAKTTPGFADVTSDLSLGARQVVLNVNRDALARYGVNMDTVRTTLYSAFGSRTIATVYTAANDYAVILEADKSRALDPSALSKVFIKSSNNQLVRLDSVAEVTLRPGPTSIARQGQLPAVTLSFNLAPGFTLGEATEQMRALGRDLAMPATITGQFAGTAQVFENSFRDQPLLIAAAIITIYIVLGILYESFIHPVTILSGLPSASLGALLTLWFFDMELTIIAMIGIILLVGLVKKNAIMMVDFAIEQRARGKSPEEAIRQACLLRFRPIMMTTAAALFGTLPIAHGLGRRRRAAPAARSRGRRRAGAVAVADALHHAGDLPHLRAAERADGGGQARACRQRTPPARRRRRLPSSVGCSAARGHVQRRRRLSAQPDCWLTP